MDFRNFFYLSKLKKNVRLNHLNVGVFDTESISTKNHTFRVGCVYSIYNHREIKKSFTTIKEMFDFLFEFDLIYCYNISFDANYLLDHLIDNKYAYGTDFFLIESANLLGMVITHKETQKKVIIKDFFPFCLDTLENACKSFKVPTTKYAVDFDSCTFQEIEKHCLNDVQMLYELIMIYRNIMWMDFTVDIINKKDFSLAALGLRVFRTNYISEGIRHSYIYKSFSGESHSYEYVLDNKLYQFLQKTYKGGYTNAFDDKTHVNCRTLDISSAYPFGAIALNLPTGKGFWTNSLEMFEECTKKIPGFCEVTLNVHYNCLPMVFDNKFGLVTGKVHQFLTSLELFWLLSRGYATLIHFHKGVYFKEFSRDYSRYCNDLYKRKSRFGREDTRREIVKRLLVALSGKWGEKLMKSRIEYTFSLEKPVGVIYQKRGLMYFTKTRTESTKMLKHSFVGWISLITAFTRIYLMENVIELEGFYTDTDSITTKHLTGRNVGKGLGMLDTEKEWKVFRARAPKTYAGVLTNGKRLVKAKGIPSRIQSSIFSQIMNDSSICTSDFTEILKWKKSLSLLKVQSQNAHFGGYITTHKQLTPKLKDTEHL